MSHVFISYAHEDKAHLDKLVAWLHDNGFNDREIWYDRYIEGGNNWRDEIATALDEAFAVLAIVTTASVKSLYCTFEWGYAMGQGIPVLPLAFDNLSVTEMFPPLTAKQLTICTESIPASLKEQISHLRTTPPQVAAINKAVYEAIYDTHRRFFILGWIGDNLNYGDGYAAEIVITHFVRGASTALQKLETLMTDKAFAFSGKQYRYCWILFDFLKRFSQLTYSYESYGKPPVLQFEDSWLQAFEYFDDEGWWNKAIRPYFKEYLDIKDTNIEVFAEVMRAFSDIDPIDAETIIHNAIVDHDPKQTKSDNELED